MKSVTKKMSWLELILCDERENEQKRVLTECHAKNDIIFTEQTERRRDGLELYEQSVNMTTGHQSIVD